MYVPPGPRSYDAIYDLDTSMEQEIDRLPLEDILVSLAADATKIHADSLPDTQVFINNSKPGTSK